MNIGLIGAGRAGTALGRHLTRHGIVCAGYYNRSLERAKKAAELTGSTAFSDVDDLIAASDVIVIATPDGVIEKVAQQLRKRNLAKRPGGKEAQLVHLSGSLSSEVLGEGGGASAHPMIAISDPETDLSSAFFTLEGKDETVTLMERLLRTCGNETVRIATKDKARYHCAGTTASNLMVALMEMAMNLLADCGFDQDQARRMLTPLATGNMEAICRRGTKAALTGPVERGDRETIQRHLAALEDKDGDEKQVYRLLSRMLVPLARRRNPARDYRDMEDLLRTQR